MHVTALSLSYFRNYNQLHLQDLPRGLIGLSGANGSGKTNILEAVSILAPGRGLRNASDLDLRPKNNMTASWAIHAKLDGLYGPQDMGLGIDPIKNRRLFHLNGQKVKSSQDRADLLRCLWLTPAHDRIFMDAASGRRKLLDRWVFTHDPAHAGRITRLDRLLAERNRLLGMARADPLWLDALETDLAATALAVATARVDYLDRLRGECLNNNYQGIFPQPSVHLKGFLEERIGHEPALAIEYDYRMTLKNNRHLDQMHTATTVGPHRSDLCVTYIAKNMAADQCSTGEQKALLFALFMAHVQMITREYKEAPVLLLDEITAHLDIDRRHFLLTSLLDLGAQVMISATGDSHFSNIPLSALYHVSNGIVTLV